MFARRRIPVLVIFVLVLISTSSAQIRITDDLNRAVVLPAPATRVVSLAPSITETLFAVGAGEQVAGVTDYCNYPSGVTRCARVGGVINPSIETIVGLKPDLIILTAEGNIREDFDKLAGMGIPLFVTNPRNLEGIYKSIETIGVLTGHKRASDSLVADMKNRVGRLSMRMGPRAEKRVMMIVALQPLIVVGKGTFLNELISLAGGRNIAAESPATYPTYSRESVIKEDPEIIVIMSDVVQSVEELTTFYPEWAKIKAVQNKQMFRVDSDIMSRPGPRAINALETLNSIIQSGRMH